MREGLALAPLCTRSLGAQGSVFVATISQTVSVRCALDEHEPPSSSKPSPKIRRFSKTCQQPCNDQPKRRKTSVQGIIKRKSQENRPIAKCERKRWQEATLHHMAIKLTWCRLGYAALPRAQPWQQSSVAARAPATWGPPSSPCPPGQRSAPPRQSRHSTSDWVQHVKQTSQTVCRPALQLGATTA